MKTIALTLLATAALVAQDKPSAAPAKPATPPATAPAPSQPKPMPEALMVEYFRQQAAMATAALAQRDAVDQMRDFCQKNGGGELTTANEQGKMIFACRPK